MSRPNILLITTDQQRFDTVCAAGYPHMITPNLDRLAAEGCLFTNAYSPNPVCMPARHNIITGLGCRHHTFDDNYFDDSHTLPYELPTFAQCLSDAGYDTKAIGKMHFQPCRRHNGFCSMELMEEIPRYREEDAYAMYLKEQGYGQLQSLHGVRHMLYMQPQQSLVDEAHHGSAWVADRTIRYLRERSKGRPFMLWAGFIAPHPPFDVPQSFADLYRDRALPEPLVSKTPISALAEENKNIADYPNEQTLRRARELYFSAISFVDKQVGRILDALEETGEAENTLVVFTSDHGEMLGDFGTYQKFLPYDGSARIPMLVRYPGRVEPGSRREEFVDLNDLFPTFVDVAGLEMPGHIDYPGASLFSDQKDRSVQYIEHQHGARRWISLQNHAYKYNYYYGGGKEELFDRVADPQETENLVLTRPEFAREAMRELKERAVEMEARYGLEGCVRDGRFVSYPEFDLVFYRECNPPMFPARLADEREREGFLPLEKELELAIEREPVVDLDLLDQSYFAGTLDMEEIRRIQKKRRSE